MVIAVFGAGSYIGARFCEYARNQGAEIVPFSVSGGWVNGDTGEVNPSLRLSADLDGIVYLAQSPQYRQIPQCFWHLQAINATAPAYLAAQLAAVNPGAKFLFASTGTVYQPAFASLAEDAPLNRANGYALSKIHGEEAVSLFSGSLDVTSVRLFGVYGPGQTGKLVPNLIDSIQAGRTLSCQPNPQDLSDRGGLRISLCHVDDAVTALYALLSVRGLPIVNLGAETALSVREIAEVLGEAAGIAPVIEAAAQPRGGDLIANMSLLRRYLPLPGIALRDVAAELVRSAGVRPA